MPAFFTPAMRASLVLSLSLSGSGVPGTPDVGDEAEAFCREVADQGAGGVGVLDHVDLDLA